MTTASPIVILDARGRYARSGLSISRNSTKYVFSSAGVLVAVSANALAWDCDPTTGAERGLLIEDQRTNRILHADDRTQSGVWTTSALSVSSNAAAAPDGTTTMDKLVESAANSTHYLEQGVTITAGQRVCYSEIVRAGGRTRGQLQIAGAVDGANGLFDLASKTMVVSTFGATTVAAGGVIDLGGGFYRVWLSCIVNGSSTAVAKRLYLADGSSSTTYAGDGASGLYVWSAQGEDGAYPSSRIPTAGSTATRLADVVTLALSALTGAQAWSGSRGTLLVEWMVPHATIATTNSTIVGVDDGTTGEWGVMRTTGTSGLLDARVNDGAAAQVIFNTGAAVANNTPLRSALAWDTNDFAAVHQGASLGVGGGSATSGTTPTVTTLRVGSHPTAGQHLNGHARRLVAYPRRLATSRLLQIAK